MRGVFIQERVVPVARSPYRADVAMFVGFVDRRRGKHLPDGDPTDETLVQPIVPTATQPGDPSVFEWLVSEGWARRNDTAAANTRIDELLNIPVPVDTFDAFGRLFAWEFRPCGVNFCDTYLGAAVRSFFAAGGRLAYIVRVDTPFGVPLTTADAAAVVAARQANLEKLVPTAIIPSPGDDRIAWKGVWTVYGLPDVSFITAPDLADVVRTGLAADPPLPPDPPIPVAFEACSAPSTAGEDDEHIRDLLAPTADESGYLAWSRTVTTLAQQVALVRSNGGLREMTVVAAIPIPDDPTVGTDLTKYLSEELGFAQPPFATSFLQLGFPWLVTQQGASGELPQNLEPPEGLLCGTLARNALERGTFRSAAGRRLQTMLSTSPVLPGRDLADPSDTSTLSGRVSLIGATALGFQLLSDVTTSLDPLYRLGQASRTMASLIRALRVIGEQASFEASNEALWLWLRQRAEDVLRSFYVAGALVGSSEKDAFAVRCDRTTMSQDDLDSGRAIVTVTLAIASSIQRIDLVITQHGTSAVPTGVG
ncbi:MAG TPA: hypothetical protein VGM88_15215 [Kofleriaceae bacterium]|jgi:hypothetical protein